jgi:predicted hydrocarbon binding protein
MHGIIFSEIKKYATAKLGPEAWNKLLEESGIGFKVYMVTNEYPDSEAVALVAAASRSTGIPVAGVLEDFGAFIVPDLLMTYGASVRPEWKTLDVLENTENVMHAAVRVRNHNAQPPRLVCERVGPHEVVINYSSQRKMCALAKGIVKGIAGHFKEAVSISEPQCMLKGDPTCKLVVHQQV